MSTRMSCVITLRHRRMVSLDLLWDPDTAQKSQSTQQLHPKRNEEALMKKSLICAALLIFISCLAATRSNAQQIYLFSQSSCEQDGVDCASSIGPTRRHDLRIFSYRSRLLDQR